jgi:hypothetical protein
MSQYKIIEKLGEGGMGNGTLSFKPKSRLYSMGKIAPLFLDL